MFTRSGRVADPQGRDGLCQPGGCRWRCGNDKPGQDVLGVAIWHDLAPDPQKQWRSGNVTGAAEKVVEKDRVR